MARRAGVGIGTPYRYSPTREDLFEAVYRREVQQLSELADQLKDEAAPVEALRRWLRAGVEFVATKKGMAAVLSFAVAGSSEVQAHSFDLTRAAGVLLVRTVAAGEIRFDIEPEKPDPRSHWHVLCMHNQPGWRASILCLIDVLIVVFASAPGPQSKQPWCDEAATIEVEFLPSCPRRLNIDSMVIYVLQPTTVRRAGSPASHTT